MGTPRTGTSVLAGDHAGKMGRAAGSRDDDAEPAAFGGGGELEQQIGRAVGGDDLRFVRDLELAKDFDGRREGLVVAFGAHDDGDEGFLFHQKTIIEKPG